MKGSENIGVERFQLFTYKDYESFIRNEESVLFMALFKHRRRN